MTTNPGSRPGPPTRTSPLVCGPPTLPPTRCVPEWPGLRAVESVETTWEGRPLRLGPAEIVIVVSSPVRENLTVAIPPPVSAEQAAAAIDRIAERRRQVDDPNAWRLSEDPADVLAYLRSYSREMPAWVLEADVLDGLELRLRLWWLGEVAESWLLEQADRLGLPPRLVGGRLGVSSRQGVHDRRRAARQKVARLRGEPVGDARRPADQGKRDRETEWLQRHRADLLAIAEVAVGHAELGDAEAAEWLIEVARDLREAVLTPGSLQLLRFALVALAASPEVEHLTDHHPLSQAFSRWSQLFSTHPAF